MVLATDVEKEGKTSKSGSSKSQGPAMFLIYLKSPNKFVLQSSLNNGGGGIVMLTPPNDAIVYQCSNSEEVGIQKVNNEKIIIANVENTQLSLF